MMSDTDLMLSQPMSWHLRGGMERVGSASAARIQENLRCTAPDDIGPSSVDSESDGFKLETGDQVEAKGEAGEHGHQRGCCNDAKTVRW